MAISIFDLEEIFTRAKEEIVRLSGKNVLLTGQTGFFGIWLLSLFSFTKHRGIPIPKLYVVSRNPGKFCRTFPEVVENLNIHWIESDIRFFDLPNVEIDYVLHGASTSASETYQGIKNVEKFKTIVDGTEHTLSVAKKHGSKSFLYLSSGAIYGENLAKSPIPETKTISLNHLNPRYTLGSAKFAAETFCALYREEMPSSVINIARCFSFVGPYLPLDLHYVIGNFIRDSLHEKEIRVKSDGKSIRSYLYMSDAIIWILKALCLSRSEKAPLNIGSEYALSVDELARLVALLTESQVIYLKNEIRDSSPAATFYVPCTSLTRATLCVDEWTNLQESISRTVDFYLNSK